MGHASLFGPTTHQAASFGFGYRAVFNRLGLDMSFLNFQLDDSGGYYGSGSSVVSLIKLEGLYFTSPTANRSAYFGGGVSYGRTQIRMQNGVDFPTTGRGSGLQGELTFGYEIARVTSARLFAQADVTLPFYDVVFETFTYPVRPPNGRLRAADDHHRTTVRALVDAVGRARLAAPPPVSSLGASGEGRSAPS